MPSLSPTAHPCFHLRRCLIQLTLDCVLPTQDVHAPRRSCLQAPKPNVVYARSSGPFFVQSDLLDAAFRLSATRAASNHTIQPMSSNTATRWNSPAYCGCAQGREIDRRFAHTEYQVTQSLSAKADAGEGELKLVSQESEEEQECNAADSYICPVKCPGKMSRQTPHISRSNSNTNV